MFNKCHKLKQIKGIHNFNTSKVIKMNSMFRFCKELEYLDLSKFNTSNVTNMGYMFNECHKLKQIKGIHNFNTSKVTNMKAMFEECMELEYLDLSNFNTSNIINIGYMFYNCHKLKRIKGINNFILINVKNKDKIVDGCNDLEYLILSKFNIMINNNNEKPISVIFNLVEQNIHYSIACYSSDIFTTIEEQLYDEYPDLKQQNIYFVANGNVINKSDSLEKNKIKNSTNILINYL